MIWMNEFERELNFIWVDIVAGKEWNTYFFLLMVERELEQYQVDERSFHALNRMELICSGTVNPFRLQWLLMRTISSLNNTRTKVFDCSVLVIPCTLTERYGGLKLQQQLYTNPWWNAHKKALNMIFIETPRAQKPRLRCKAIFQLQNERTRLKTLLVNTHIECLPI